MTPSAISSADLLSVAPAAPAAPRPGGSAAFDDALGSAIADGRPAQQTDRPDAQQARRGADQDQPGSDPSALDTASAGRAALLGRVPGKGDGKAASTEPSSQADAPADTADPSLLGLGAPNVAAHAATSAGTTPADGKHEATDAGDPAAADPTAALLVPAAAPAPTAITAAPPAPNGSTASASEAPTQAIAGAGPAARAETSTSPAAPPPADPRAAAPDRSGADASADAPSDRWSETAARIDVTGLSGSPADGIAPADVTAASAPSPTTAPASAAVPAPALAPVTAAAPTAPAAPVAQQPALVEQLHQPIVALRSAQDGDHVVVIRVTPEHLGTVTVHATVSRGDLSVQLFASNPDGRDALKGMLTDLRRDLGSGATGTATTLSLGTGDAPQQQGRQAAGWAGSDASGGRRPWEAARATPAAERAAAAAPVPTDRDPRSRTSSALLDVLV